MTQFVGNALQWLGGVFGISGGAGGIVRTDQIDLSDVQLVTDVTRMAGNALAPGNLGGWMTITFTATADTGGDPVAIMQLIGYTGLTLRGQAIDPESHQVWIYGFGVQTDDVDWTSIAAGITHATTIRALGASNARQVLFGCLEADLVAMNATPSQFQPIKIPSVFPQPVYYDPRGLLEVIAITNSATPTTIVCAFLARVLPIGASPI